MNWVWVKTDRGEVLRDMDAPANAAMHKPAGPRGVHRGGGGVICTVPPFTPGFKHYVKDRKSEHYGQPIETHSSDRANLKAATDGRYQYRHPGDH